MLTEQQTKILFSAFRLTINSIQFSHLYFHQFHRHQTNLDCISVSKRKHIACRWHIANSHLIFKCRRTNSSRPSPFRKCRKIVVAKFSNWLPFSLNIVLNMAAFGSLCVESRYSCLSGIGCVWKCSCKCKRIVYPILNLLKPKWFWKIACHCINRFHSVTIVDKNIKSHLIWRCPWVY